MSTLIIYFLALIQAVAEFLPISSSGHLNLVQHLTNFSNPLVLDIFLNTANLLSVLVFFRKKITDIFKHIPYLIASVVPLTLFVLFTNHQLDKIFATPIIIVLGFLLTSIILFSTKNIKPNSKKINFDKAIIIGLIQTLAVFPGVSRSATTIFAALLLGLSAKDAFEYSFYLYIPSSLGTLFLSLSKGLTLSYFSVYAFPFLVCFLIGILSLNILKKITINHKLWYFSFYTLFMSALSYFLLF